MQEFNLDKKFKTLMQVALFIFLAFSIFGVALPFLPDNGKGNAENTFVLSVICTVGFGFFGTIALLTLKKLPYTDIVIDDDGLWYKHEQKKHALVSWKSIDRIKERNYLQCLDILDSDGRKLIRIEYQLNDFATLRSILIDKVSHLYQQKQHTHFSKGTFYHLFNVGCIIGFLLLGLFVGKSSNILLGYIGMVVLVICILYEYFSTAYCVDISENSLTICFPLKKASILYSDIVNIKIADTFQKGMRYPEVWVTTRNTKKPYKLKRFDVDANILFIALNKTIN